MTGGQFDLVLPGDGDAVADSAPTVGRAPTGADAAVATVAREVRVADAELRRRIAAGETPALFAVDARAVRRFWEFFAADLRNANTRSTYLAAVYRFADWCEGRGLALATLEPVAVAAYVELLGREYATATVKLHLSAIRRLFDWLVIGQVVRHNPAAPVRGPRHVVRKGKTPVLSAEDARGLLDSIDARTLVGLRDRALIAVMLYSFARVSAAVGLAVGDYTREGRRSWFRLTEKGGRAHRVPAHHTAEALVDAWLEASGLAERRRHPLFPRLVGRGAAARLAEEALTRQAAAQMVKRRAAAAGLPEGITNHSFRGTGITEYLRAGGTLETAARIAGHASTSTTQLYDRTDEALTLDEIERIHI